MLNRMLAFKKIYLVSSALRPSRISSIALFKGGGGVGRGFITTCNAQSDLVSVADSGGKKGLKHEKREKRERRCVWVGIGRE